MSSDFEKVRSKNSGIKIHHGDSAAAFSGSEILGPEGCGYLRYSHGEAIPTAESMVLDLNVGNHR